MGDRYEGRIKVVGVDLLCFPADKETLEPLGCGCYDTWAWKDPDHPPEDTMHINDWQVALNKQRDSQRNQSISSLELKRIPIGE